MINQNPQTTDEFLDYYADLLPSQYRLLPNARQTIKTLAALGLMPQGGNVVTDQFGDPEFVNGQLVIDSPYGELLPLAVGQAFSIQTAVGQQLQYLAQQIGAMNSGYNLQGQLVTLDDADFRLLLQAAGARNFLRATTPAIVSFVTQYFNGIMTVADDLNMQMTFFYEAQLGIVPWAELFITQGFLPRPLGVAAKIIYIYPVTSLFGFRTYSVPPQPGVLPACTYSAPVHSAHPVLTYSDFLEVV